MDIPSIPTHLFAQKDEEKKELNPKIEELIKRIKEINEKENNSQKTRAGIQVNDLLKSAVSLYEKIRSTIDFREEHLLRQGAIRRIVSRKIRFSTNKEKIAEVLVYELIQSGYLSKESISEEQIERIQAIINKFLFLGKYLDAQDQNYFLSIIASEIEEQFSNHLKEEVLISILEDTIIKDVPQENLESKIDEVKSIFLPLAARQVFLKYDKPSLRLFLIKKYWPQWFKTKTNDQDVAPSIKQLLVAKRKMEEDLDNNSIKKLTRIVRVYNPAFIILREIINNDDVNSVEEVLTHRQKLSSEIEQLATKYYASTRAKLHRSIVRAVIFIFFTKMLLGILLEIPYENYFLGGLNWLPLTINLLFPPLLMLVSASLIGIPGRDNTEKLIGEIENIIYKKEEQEKTRIYLRLSSNEPIGMGLKIGYALTFLIIIGLIAWLLASLEFNLVSGALFFFFISVVSFLAFRIRQSAKELMVIETEKEGFWAGVADFFLLPFLRIGYWLATKFEGINIFLFFLDFIIEAPFKIVMEVFGRWIAFVREKKEELIN